MKIYVAGPMRGVPYWNWPYFTRVTENLRKDGYEVVNPAEMDAAAGITPPPDGSGKGVNIRELISKDLAEVCKCDAIVVLKDWKKSTAAPLEVHTAQVLGMPIYNEWMQPLPQTELENILEEANRITSKDRNDTYGHPLENFGRTAAVWSAILGTPVTPEQVGLCMIAVKLLRQTHKPQRDNLTDICGYARCIEMIFDKRSEMSELVKATDITDTMAK